MIIHSIAISSSYSTAGSGRTDILMLMQRALAALGIVFFAALPATSTYQLNSYGFGSGGGTSSTSTYSVEGISGETGSGAPQTTTYKVQTDFVGTEQANVPKIASFDNSSGQYYNKLHFVLDTQGNPTD